MTSFQATLSVSILSLALMACPSSLENPERFGDGSVKQDAASDGSVANTCGNVEADILAKKCGASGCHNAGGTQGPDLASPAVKSRLLGVDPSQKCSSKGAYIVQGQPTGGTLYNSIQPTGTAGMCTSLSMRTLSGAGGAPTEAEAKCLEQWIADVANGN